MMMVELSQSVTQEITGALARRRPLAWVGALSLAFVAVRLLYSVTYVADCPSLHSALFSGGPLCTVGLFVIAA
jgi:uncharacterized MAPEG superfamily protein